jgi:BolA protein
MNRLDKMRSLLTHLNPVQLEIEDDSHLHAGHAGARDGGGHYRINITSSEFSGRSTVARHRMVYSCLREMMTHEIHALNITASSPESR